MGRRRRRRTRRKKRKRRERKRRLGGSLLKSGTDPLPPGPCHRSPLTSESIGELEWDHPVPPFVREYKSLSLPQNIRVFLS